MQLITLEWGEKLTKTALAVMVKMRLELRKELPAPEDVKKLTEYVTNELKPIPLEEKYFFIVVRLAETRLLIYYNRRQSGKIESVT